MLDSLTKPLSIREIKKQSNNGKTYITANVTLELSDIYDGHESFLDALSQKLVGSELLMDITYSVVGGKGTAVVFEVSGDVSQVLESEA